jgi:hypothetical protein
VHPPGADGEPRDGAGLPGKLGQVDVDDLLGRDAEPIAADAVAARGNRRLAVEVIGQRAAVVVELHAHADLVAVVFAVVGLVQRGRVDHLQREAERVVRRELAQQGLAVAHDGLDDVALQAAPVEFAGDLADAALAPGGPRGLDGLAGALVGLAVAQLGARLQDETRLADEVVAGDPQEAAGVVGVLGELAGAGADRRDRVAHVDVDRALVDRPVAVDRRDLRGRPLPAREGHDRRGRAGLDRLAEDLLIRRTASG